MTFQDQVYIATQMCGLICKRSEVDIFIKIYETVKELGGQFSLDAAIEIMYPYTKQEYTPLTGTSTVDNPQFDTK